MMTADPPLDSPVIALPDEAATLALGAALAVRLRPGLFVGLIGPLGVGKSTLARGLVQAWTGQGEDAPSPTFTLVQTYDGPHGPLWHADLYRLRHPQEVEELGLLEALEDAAVLVEWPERLGRLLPAQRAEIHLAFDGAGRCARLRGISR